ncbi:hypothetical protein RRG08_000913 [Elysia crispata]|uniref:Uncharacterized protein n=1 Tax=Elysia crispata TaxID=231223 RepID=A0AAE1DWD0_9GAST|nr:hypothetical protein RRG08_000913 [Elysia crispata]
MKFEFMTWVRCVTRSSQYLTSVLRLTLESTTEGRSSREVVVMPFTGVDDHILQVRPFPSLHAPHRIAHSSSRGCEKSLKQVALKEFRSCVSLVYLSEVNLAGVQP